MNELKINQRTLFDEEIESDELVVKFSNGREKYSIEEIKNKVIWGDAFKVLEKIDDESFDMVFVDPPYFLQLPKKDLKRWRVKSIVEGVNDDLKNGEGIEVGG